MANIIYNDYKLGLVTGGTAITSGATNVWVGLTSGYSGTVSEDDNATTITAAELTTAGTNYVRKNLTGVTLTSSTTGMSTTDYIMLDAEDVTWSTASLTADGAFVYVTTAVGGGTIGSGTDVKPVCWVDFGGNKTASAGDFKIIWSTNGLIQYKQA